MPTAADDALFCRGAAKTLIRDTWWKVLLQSGSKRFHYEPHYFSCLDLSAEMLVSFLQSRLGCVLLVLLRVCVGFCATEAAALTVMLLSLPPSCQQNCVDLTGTLSLVCSREKAETLIASLMWWPSRDAAPFI